MLKIDYVQSCDVQVVNNNVKITYKNVRDCGCRTNFVFTNGKQYIVEFDFQTDNTNAFCRNVSINLISNNLSYDTKLGSFGGKTAGQNKHVKITTGMIPNDGKQYVLFLNGNNFMSGVTGYSEFSNISIKEIGTDDNLVEDDNLAEDDNLVEDDTDNEKETINEKDAKIKELEEQLNIKNTEIKKLEKQLGEKEAKIKELEVRLENNNENQNNNISNEELNSLVQSINDLEEMLYNAQHDLNVLKNNI